MLNSEHAGEGGIKMGIFERTHFLNDPKYTTSDMHLYVDGFLTMVSSKQIFLSFF